MSLFFLVLGSILFPTKEQTKTSETKQSFQGEFAKRPDIIRLADANIKLEGRCCSRFFVVSVLVEFHYVYKRL